MKYKIKNISQRTFSFGRAMPIMRPGGVVETNTFFKAYEILAKQGLIELEIDGVVFRDDTLSHQCASPTDTLKSESPVSSEDSTSVPIFEESRIFKKIKIKKGKNADK